MEFHVELAGAQVDPLIVQDILFEVDPAGLVDLDRSGRELRVSASLEVADVVELMRRAGVPVAPAQVVQQPSICCGECGG